ncbi:hypothetical protein [Kitasatospora sp. NPDC056181]|uniref:hypothetical protein n=1 Tax=Kitasatospora sp. NPDC056181 TaxID=3345737 RepID=UPI0035DED94D
MATSGGPAGTGPAATRAAQAHAAQAAPVQAVPVQARAAQAAPARARGLRAVALPLVAAVLVAAGVSGCGKDSGQDAAAGGQPKWTAEQDTVRKDYLAYWDSLLQANANPGKDGSGADGAGLPERAAGNQLAQLRQNLQALGTRNLVAKGPVDHTVRGIEVRAQTAALEDCVAVRKWLQYDATSGQQDPGQLVDRPNQLAHYTLAQRDGHWLVTDSQVLGPC